MTPYILVAAAFQGASLGYQAPRGGVVAVAGEAVDSAGEGRRAAALPRRQTSYADDSIAVQSPRTAPVGPWASGTTTTSWWSAGLQGGANSGFGPLVRWGPRSFGVELSVGVQPLLRWDFSDPFCSPSCSKIPRLEGVSLGVAGQANALLMLTPWHTRWIDLGLYAGYKYSSEFSSGVSGGFLVREGAPRPRGAIAAHVTLGVTLWQRESTFSALPLNVDYGRWQVALSGGLSWQL